MRAQSAKWGRAVPECTRGFNAELSDDEKALDSVAPRATTRLGMQARPLGASSPMSPSTSQRGAGFAPSTRSPAWSEAGLAL